ncbi:cytochrome c family protein [Novosphingobium panipatense]|uniref:c-type cytochrome n=1 Tax=Novosphingobium TaxID=165696 RepID=UPI000CDB683C|nr:cytochrome C [Novosphingobium sp. HII-3]
MTKPATLLALSMAATVAACGDKAPDQAASPTVSSSPAAAPAPAGAAALSDPAPPAFATCRSCHSTQPGQNGIGPSLHGIVGAKAAGVPGYAYTPALKNAGITWTRDSLDTWLAGPIKMVPGTRMVLPVPDAAKRKAIIDYLETLK